MLDKKTAFKILYVMKKIRATEEAIAEEYSHGEMRCPTHLSIGQEAVAAVVGCILDKGDLAVSTHRAHAHYIGKGGDLNALIAEIYGKETGCSRGNGGSMHLVDRSVGFVGSTAIVGNTIPVGVGLGLGIKYRKAKQISCIFLGDGAIEEGAFYEAANFAVLAKLPVLFVCENNLYSVYSPLTKRQPRDRKIYELARAIGLKSAHEDGNDVSKAYDIIKKMVSKVRRGLGPHFIELSTYRWREHCGPNYDNDLGYRSVAEFKKWKSKDPIAKVQRDLMKDASMSREDILTMEQNLNKEIKLAFEYARGSPFPSSESLVRQIFHVG